MMERLIAERLLECECIQAQEGEKRTQSVTRQRDRCVLREERTGTK